MTIAEFILIASPALGGLIGLLLAWWGYPAYLVERYIFRKEIRWHHGQSVPKWVADAMGDGDWEIRELEKPREE